MKTKTYIIGMACVALFLSGCKTTEKNYQQAYEAARAKREAVQAETMLPSQGLYSDDGPQLRVVNGDTVFVEKLRLRDLDGNRPSKKWYLSVGKYKMNTNAKANAENLRREGYAGAEAMKSSASNWFTIVSGASTLDSVAASAKQFQLKHKGYPYVGQPNAPVIIYNL